MQFCNASNIIDIGIPKEGKNIEIPHGKIISLNKPEKLYSRQAGVKADLDDECFSEEYGAKGFWEPWSFFEQFGGTIYYLEEYDPDKTPVLFIHGAIGTPNCFIFFGLPAGDYKLFLKAEGYIPSEKKYSVIPGIPKYFRITVLTPD